MEPWPCLLPISPGKVKADKSLQTCYDGQMKWLTIILLALPQLAMAQDTGTTMVELYPPMPGVEYYCTDATGARREIGDVICITASCQVWVARCEVSLNNPTWRKLSDGCPGVSAKPMGVMERLEALRAG